jgi:putative tryptophan/tyrosine transport system substrate-binding protein
MRRREFIAGLGSATAWPLAVRAQQPTMPVVGYLSGGKESALGRIAAAFRRGLGEQGFVEGRNVEILHRWAEDRYDLLPALAADLVRNRVAAIVATTPGTASALAAKSATPTIPIVFAIGEDPVELGLVASFNHPGGNATGVSFLTSDLVAKRLELLHKIVPAGTQVGFLVSSAAPQAEAQMREAEKTAHILGARLLILNVKSAAEIETAFARLAAQGGGAFLVAAGSLFFEAGPQLVALAAQHRLPTVYPYREMVESGGLMSYGADIPDAIRLAGIYVGRILRGEKAAELPVVRPTNFEFAINLKTAKELSLAIPETLLATADKVIE